jgi:uncharacterized DUF497 family protein
MPEIEFEWDPSKDRANQAAHGVSFAEASTAFMAYCWMTRIIPMTRSPETTRAS